MTERIDVYFDYISPYAYFGWRNARKMAGERGLELVAKPVLFAALLDHYGHLGPAEIPPKRAWTFRHVARYAAVHRIPLVGPAEHPFRSLTALRISLALANDPERQHAAIDTLYDAIWAEGIDGGDDDAIADALGRRGFDGAALLERARTPDAKDALKRATTEAVEAGVFGVPTFVVRGETFWGNDSLEHVELVLDDADPLDPALTERILARPAGAQRKR